MAKRTKNASEKEVKEVFRENFRRTRDYTQAFNATMDMLGGKWSPDVSPAHAEDLAKRRTAVSTQIRKIQESVLYEEGDPLTVAAVDAAKLAAPALEALNGEYERVVQEIRDELEGSVDEDDLEDAVSERLENIEYPILYLEFNEDKGELTGWVVEHPQYYRGHEGPVVAVFPGMDLAEVKGEIEGVLSESPPFLENPSTQSGTPVTKKLKSKLLR